MTTITIEGTEFTATSMTTLRQQLHDYYGDRNYRITHDGEMQYKGNPLSDTDRSQDFWHFGGYVISK